MRTRERLAWAGARTSATWQSRSQTLAAVGLRKGPGSPSPTCLRSGCILRLRTRFACPSPWLCPPAGTGNSITVVTTNGSLCQELQIKDNFQEHSTSFLGFQLVPEVPGSPRPCRPHSPGCCHPHRDFCFSRSSSGRRARDTMTSTSGALGTWPSPLTGFTCRTAPRSTACSG